MLERRFFGSWFLVRGTADGRDGTPCRPLGFGPFSRRSTARQPRRPPPAPAPATTLCHVGGRHHATTLRRVRLHGEVDGRLKRRGLPRTRRKGAQVAEEPFLLVRSRARGSIGAARGVSAPPCRSGRAAYAAAFVTRSKAEVSISKLRSCSGFSAICARNSERMSRQEGRAERRPHLGRGR